VPVRVPVAVGVKVTEIVHFAPAATELPQVCVSAKSPEALIDVMESAAVPEFVSVMVCAALVEPVVCEANVRLVGERVTAGDVVIGRAPVPLKATVWGEPLALSVMVTVPVRAPVAVGVKLTEMVQLVPPATTLPQVLVSAKSPEAAIDEMLNAD
jgi:hypothetical protein